MIREYVVHPEEESLENLVSVHREPHDGERAHDIIYSRKYRSTRRRKTFFYVRPSRVAIKPSYSLSVLYHDPTSAFLMSEHSFFPTPFTPRSVFLSRSASASVTAFGNLEAISLALFFEIPRTAVNITSHGLP